MMNKKCKKCDINMDLTFFYKKKSNDKIYHANTCKECTNKITKKWIENNKHRYRACRKKYRELNKCDIREKHKLWRKNNPDKVKKNMKKGWSKYYLKNKGILIKKSKEYKNKNKDSVDYKTKRKRHNKTSYERHIIDRRKRNKKNWKKNRSELSSVYVKKLILKSFKIDKKHLNQHPELVELKKMQLQGIRKIKQLTLKTNDYK